MARKCWLTLFGAALVAACVNGAEAPPGGATPPPAKPKPPPLTFALTPETAGPDFAIQGEYAGKIGDAALGCDVVAFDKGRFRAVFFRGGLPGDDGFDEKSRTEVSGQSMSDLSAAGGTTTVFDGKWQAKISGDTMTGKTDKGEDFSLKHTMRHSPTEGLKPPAGALVLFDGTNAEAWRPGRMDERNLLAYGAVSKQAFTNFTLHVEFIEPFMPGARD